ncbi:hypothetical protein, partial [Prevotella pallens]|uniref:hypothetical protein n=1 Tax=Prevotella pallens TaxID=60133 RepID=UPI00352FBD02
MNRPLRLAECFVGISRIVRWTFRGCSLGVSCVFVGILWNVRHVIAIRLQHYWQTVSSRRGRFIVPAY